MPDQGHGVVVGLDNGGTTNNATVLDSDGRFLVDHMLETHSLVQEGPEKAIEALARAFAGVLEVTGTPAASVLAVGLDTPGPASANGVISARGAVNFLHPAWRAFDIRGALEDRLGLPVIYNNDANAAALYAHYMRLGRGCGLPLLGIGDRRHRARRRGDRVRPGGARRRRDGRRARPCPDPDRGTARSRAAGSGLQLRAARRRRELRLADRDHRRTCCPTG